MAGTVNVLRLAVGTVSLALALGFTTCGSPAVALADEEALVLVSDGEDAPEDMEDEDVAEEPEQVEPQEAEGEDVSAGDAVEEQVGEPEHEDVQEPEQVETAEADPTIAEIASDVEEIRADVEALDLQPLVDLQMMATGALGALLGSVAFAGLWRVLGGGR